MIRFSLALLLLLGAAKPAAKKLIRQGEIAVGPCAKDDECVVLNPAGCCDNCSREPIALLRGHPAEPACGCALKEPGLDTPPCATVQPASAFRAVCKKKRCTLQRK